MNTWPAESIWELVSPLLPGFTVEVLPEIDSSSTELMRRARAGQTEPTLLVAERQTAGRGRMGRPWQSAVGDSLTFSLSLPYAPRDWSGLSLAVGLAVAESLHPDIGLKWPNDLWWQDRKLAGILVEAATSGGRSQVVIGIGINIRPRPAEGVSTPPAALAELWPEAQAGQALLRLMPTLVHTLQAFEQHGFAPLQARFNARDVLRGREVHTSDGLRGQSLGVGATGALRLLQAEGERLIDSSEVSVRPSTRTQTDGTLVDRSFGGAQSGTGRLEPGRFVALGLGACGHPGTRAPGPANPSAGDHPAGASPFG